MESDRYERVMAAMRREVPDRVPWTLWGHFPAVPFLKYYSWEKANREGEESAKAHMALLRALDYKMDLLKVTPFYRYMASQWGSKFRFADNEENAPTVDVVVKEPEDWGKLWVLDPRKELGDPGSRSGEHALHLHDTQPYRASSTRRLRSRKSLRRYGGPARHP
jgi:hypothetical protein